MVIDDPAVVAEVAAVFARYEAALVGNDVATLDAFFLDRPTTIRYGIAENLYGSADIAASAGAAVGRARPAARAHRHHDLRLRPCRGFDAVLP